MKFLEMFTFADDRNDTVGCTAETAIMMTTSAANRRKLMSKSLGVDGRRPHLYCMRSASVKSLNRSSGSKSVNGGGEVDETTASSSCYSLNAMPRFQQRHSFNQKHCQHQYQLNQLQQQQQHQHKQQHQQYQHHLQATDVLEQKNKLNSTPSLRITESALRR